MSILVATDLSENGRTALAAASAEARRRETTLTVLHCLDSVAERWEYIEAPPDDLEEVTEAAREKLEQEFHEAVGRVEEPTVDEFRIAEAHAADGIVDVAHEGDFELVVVGATGRGTLSRLLLGSTAEEVVRSCDTPVLVVPPESPFDEIDRIVAPVDMSECSRASLAHAADRARAADAELIVLHASSLPTGAMTLMEWEPSEEDREARLEFTSEQMQEFLEGVDLEGVDSDTELRFGAPFREIVDVSEEREADLIVMGTHGRRGFERLFLGSTATKVLRRLPCPAMTIRYRGED
jgi:nucleotide-binding universal stress UspA family protein